MLGSAAGLALAGGAGRVAGFCHGGRAGLVKEFVEFRINKALDEVSATPEQKAKILAIVKGLQQEHEARIGDHKALHDKALAALTADQVDATALEAVRAEAIQKLDEGSKVLVGAIAEAGKTLTPEQRRKLAELAEEHCK